MLFTGIPSFPSLDAQAGGLLSYNGTLEFGAKQWNFYLVDETLNTYKDFDYKLQLNLFGPLFNPRVGSYQIGLGTVASSRVESGSGKDNDKFLDTRVQSFSFGSNLFPNRPFQISSGYNLNLTQDRLDPSTPLGEQELYFSRFYLTLPKLPLITLDLRRELENLPPSFIIPQGASSADAVTMSQGILRMTTSRSASFQQNFGENSLDLSLAQGEISDFLNGTTTRNRSLSTGILLKPSQKLSINGWYDNSKSDEVNPVHETSGYGAGFTLEPSQTTRLRASHDTRFEFNDRAWLDSSQNTNLQEEDKPVEGHRVQRRNNASFSKTFSERWNFDAGYSLLDQWVEAGDQRTQEDDLSLSLGGQATARTRIFGRAEVKRLPAEQTLLLSADSSTLVLPGLTASFGVSRSQSLTRGVPGIYGASADLGYNRMLSSTFRFNGSIGGNFEEISERFRLKAYRMQAGLDGSLWHWVGASFYYSGLREVAGLKEGEGSDQLSLQLSASPWPGLVGSLSYQLGRGEDAYKEEGASVAPRFWSDLTAKVEYGWRAITIALDGRYHQQVGGSSTGAGSNYSHYRMIGLSLKRYF
ncbi:MAG: hypothetical protein ACM3TT_03570 [Syntrophothermus sp.]